MNLDLQGDGSSQVRDSSPERVGFRLDDEDEDIEARGVNKG